MYNDERLVNDKTPPGVRQWLELIDDSLDGTIDESGYDDPSFQKIIKIIKTIENQTIDPEVLSEIKDAAAWEKAKARFTKEGRKDVWEQGLEQGEKKGLLAQQRQTVIAANKMGMEIKAIAALVGLTETAVQDMLK